MKNVLKARLMVLVFILTSIDFVYSCCDCCQSCKVRVKETESKSNNNSGDPKETDDIEVVEKKKLMYKKVVEKSKKKSIRVRPEVGKKGSKNKEEHGGGGKKSKVGSEKVDDNLGKNDEEENKINDNKEDDGSVSEEIEVEEEVEKKTNKKEEINKELEDKKKKDDNNEDDKPKSEEVELEKEEEDDEEELEEEEDDEEEEKREKTEKEKQIDIIIEKINNYLNGEKRNTRGEWGCDYIEKTQQLEIYYIYGNEWSEDRLNILIDCKEENIDDIYNKDASNITIKTVLLRISVVEGIAKVKIKADNCKLEKIKDSLDYIPNYLRDDAEYLHVSLGFDNESFINLKNGVIYCTEQITRYNIRYWSLYRFKIKKTDTHGSYYIDKENPYYTDGNYYNVNNGTVTMCEDQETEEENFNKPSLTFAMLKNCSILLPQNE